MRTGQLSWDVEDTEEEGSLEAGGWTGHGSFSPRVQQKPGRRGKMSPHLSVYLVYFTLQYCGSLISHQL